MRWIATAVLVAPIVAVVIVAHRPAVPGTAPAPVTSPSGPESDEAESPPSPPARIYAGGGLVNGGVTTFYTPTVRLTPGRSDTGRLRGWEPCAVADTTSVVALEPSVRTATSRTLWALPVPPATNYTRSEWTEFRCETDDVPADARADAAWCGRWAWPSHHDARAIVFDAAPAPPAESVLVLRADGTATLGAAPGVTRRWGVVDGVLYLKRFDAPVGRFGVVIGVRDGDDVIRFAAQGEARRVR